MENKHKRQRHERLFIISFIFVTLTILVVTIMAAIYLNQYTQVIQDSIEERMIITAKLAASTLVTADELDQFWEEEDAEKPLYEEIRLRMQNFAEDNNLLYVYFMRKCDDGVDREQMILDSDPVEPLGLWYVEDMDSYTKQAFTGKSVCMILGYYNTGWDGIIAAYAPIYDDNNDIVAIVGVDITDSYILSKRNTTTTFMWIFFATAILMIAITVTGIVLFMRKARDFEQASIAKSQFLSRMSHEIRTPMNAIIGFCRMAQNTDDANQIKDYLKNIDDSSNFLLQLINSILDISKIEAGKMQLTMEEVSPYELIDTVHAMFIEQAHHKNITLKVVKEAGITNLIYCDKTYLKQVIVNIVSNALKFTPEEGEVTLYMSLKDEETNRYKLLFEISDSGIGMKPETVAKIFDAFEQGDGGITRRYGGTGLGLNISKLLVEMMGGKLQVESTEGKGSRFWFELWFDTAEEGTEPLAALEVEQPLERPDLTDKIILVVEDNEINQIIAGHTLQEFGAETEFAENGRVGVEMFLAHPDRYFCILMDVQMPEMDGYEATRLIRRSGDKRALEIPIIAMSANVFREDIEAALESGMNDHIGKPFAIEQIIKVFNKINK